MQSLLMIDSSAHAQGNTCDPFLYHTFNSEHCSNRWQSLSAGFVKLAGMNPFISSTSCSATTLGIETKEDGLWRYEFALLP